LACLALQEEGSTDAQEPVLRALNWLKGRQLLDQPGDWQENHPGLKGGGWAFQFNNPHYPDLDDTAAVAWTMHQSRQECFQESLQRAVSWICGMQSENGGFASFDADNTYYYLNEIPFADHGALLDPPTSDVSARCATLLALDGRQDPELKACLNFLHQEQEPEGCWLGRWGTNYIYGTWSVLAALEKADDLFDQSSVERAVNWLKSKQHLLSSPESRGRTRQYFLSNRLGHARPDVCRKGRLGGSAPGRPVPPPHPGSRWLMER
jgi:squalene-hopene/tetraprenyl-beta-curcumene cyclase